MPELKPRRTPKRRSSQSIVTAILDAAGELLVDAGLSGMTTNAIAKRAGVSVGSLYQYFPNKQAVCAGIAGRVNTRLLEALQDALQRDAEPYERLDAAIAVICSSEIGSHDVRRALLEYVPRSWEESRIGETEQALIELFAPLFAEIAPDLTPEDRVQRQQVVMFAVRGAVQGLMLHGMDLLGEARLRSWLRAMVVAAFDHPSPGADSLPG
ncbi:MAG: TetR/AcrR family transcriptional regulator [Myxococcota bacterium]